MFRYLILMSALLLAQNAHAADTLTLGGNGGTADWSRTCPSGKRVTGIEVRFAKGPGNVYSPLHAIRLHCRGVTSNGNWANETSEWTSFTPSDSPDYGGWTELALCSTDRFVAGFKVKAKWITTVSGPQLVIMTIALACHKITANQAFVGTPQTSNGVTAGEGVGFSGAYQYCQTGGISRGAQGRRGWYLDSMALTCTDPSG
jgi:hypothetical protein